MLYRIEIENFYSVRDPQLLDLRIPANVPDDSARFAPIFPGSPQRVAKTVGLFGPNGSGKSTVLKSLAFLLWFINKSFHYPGPNLPCERFNDEASANRPIRLAVEFGGSTPASEAGQPPEHGTFRYELTLQPDGGFIHRVTYEAIRFRRQGRGKWSRVFERSESRQVTGSILFPLTGFTPMVSKIRENASVIATLAQFDHAASQRMTAHLSRVSSNILIQRMEPPDQEAINFLAQYPDAMSSLNAHLRRADLGVERMEVKQATEGSVAVFHHNQLHHLLPWGLESDGTKSFIRLFPWLFQALRDGSLAIIDEIDRSLHTELVAEILGWFHDPERNPNGAQLLFTSHTSALLEDMVKEEVVLTEKDQSGRTRLFSLMQVEGVRRDDNLYRKYRGGVYGALPQIG